MFCFHCQTTGDMKTCRGCKYAFYCSKACQKANWKKHKQNCIAPMQSLHNLFEACSGREAGLVTSASFDYGFLDVRPYTGDLPRHLKANNILFQVYKLIVNDIENHEQGNASLVLSSIELSKKAFLGAYEKNALDSFIHEYIDDVTRRLGHSAPRWCRNWRENKLVIGPTRLLLSDSVALTEKQKQDMRKDIYEKYYVYG